MVFETCEWHLVEALHRNVSPPVFKKVVRLLACKPNQLARSRDNRSRLLSGHGMDVLYISDGSYW